jgi:hypothetical protein
MKRRYPHTAVIVPDQTLDGTTATSWQIKIGGEPLPESFASLEEAKVFTADLLRGIKSEADL